MQNNKPKITIVTITYNLIKAGREHTFRQCLDSVHNQTYKNIEHIVIDGASTDGSLELIREYADKGWITYISEPDTGIYDAMNKGLEKATGDYIAFLNSDDFYHDKKGISKIVKTLISSKADFTYAVCTYIKEDGTYYGVLSPVAGAFFVRMPFSHQTLFVKTDVMRKLGGFDSKNFKSAGDFDFIIRLFLNGSTCAECNYNFVSFRLGGLSDKQRQQSIDECKKIFVKNYHTLYPNINVDKMFDHYIVPAELFDKLKQKVAPDITKQMQHIWDQSEKKPINFRVINKFPYVGTSKIVVKQNKFYLFDFLPLLKTKLKYNVKRYLLFGFLPVLKIKYKRGKIKSYLFGFIPFTRVSDKYGVFKLRVFGLPVIKIKK